MAQDGRSSAWSTHRWTAVAVVALALSGCAGALAPAGPVAARQRWLFLVALAVATLITLGVGVLTVRAVRSRAGLADGNRFVLLGGLVMPTVVLMALMGVTFTVLAEEVPGDRLVVEVTGHQYWWEVRYPDGEVVTANEIHIPVDQPVRFVVDTDDVLHSVWVPELGGKIDMVPGRTNEVVLQADEAGSYEGYCAEYCGLQHAKMRFHVIAEPAEEFDAWLAAQAQPASVDDSRAMQAFHENSCAACHAIQGTDATGTLGPDLTHFGSREHLGAGILENDRESLREWIPATQSLKHGSLMPDLPQAEEELDLLVDLMLELE